MPDEGLWSLRNIDLRVIALHCSFVKLRMPQSTSLVPLISEPIRVNVFSFVVYKGAVGSQYADQFCTKLSIIKYLKSVLKSEATSCHSKHRCTENGGHAFDFLHKFTRFGRSIQTSSF